MVLTGAFSGALVGVVLASMLTNQVLLAIVAAFAAVVVALIVRHVVFSSHVPLFYPPALGFLHVVIASLIGGLAGHELAIDLREPPPSPLIGAISGVLSAILISSFLITIRYRRNQQVHN
jgi:preprotein translocase subunit SecF